jgi:hypothetical protein
MSDVNRQFSNGQTGYGYRQLSVVPAVTTIGLSLIFAATGAALGIMAGIAVAANSRYANTSGSPRDLGSVSSSAAGSSIHPITNAGQPPSIERHADEQGNARLSTPQESAPVATSAVHRVSAAHRVSGAHKRRAVRRLSANHKFSAGRKASSWRMLPVFLKAPPAIEPVKIEAVKLDDAAEPFSFSMEGDVTVADYDASAGMIETHEGKTFVIDTTVGESNATSWQDYHANVHYRCDQTGNCTIMRTGAVVVNAKLTT